MRPVLMWVPDLDSPNFANELRREAEEIARCPHEDEDMAWIESVSILFEEE